MQTLDKTALEATLKSLELIRDAKQRELELQKRQYQDLEVDIRRGAAAIHNLNGSIAEIRRDLGLDSDSTQTILTMQEARPSSLVAEDSEDRSRAIMLVVAQYDDKGGISFDDIFKIVRGNGLDVTREYLHTVLNRKRNRQKKLDKVNGKWFLTDKGREELGIAK